MWILTVEVSVSAIDFQTVLGGTVAQAALREQRKAAGESRTQPTDAEPPQSRVLKGSIDQ